MVEETLATPAAHCDSMPPTKIFSRSIFSCSYGCDHTRVKEAYEGQDAAGNGGRSFDGMRSGQDFSPLFYSRNRLWDNRAMEPQNGHFVDRTDDAAPDVEVRPTAETGGRKLHQLGAARRRQGLSIRCVAQRLGKTVSEVRNQEEEQADLLVSELYRWQAALEVPIEELLSEPKDSLSPRVLARARLLKVMKTAMAICRQARSETERRLARLLVEQLLEIMPELKEVSAWPTVGHRRSSDEMGRIAENPISEDWLHEAS